MSEKAGCFDDNSRTFGKINIFADYISIDNYFTARRAGEATNATHKGCFSASIHPHQTINFSFFKFCRYIL